MLQIAVCEDEQADRDNLIGILKPLLDKYTEGYRIRNYNEMLSIRIENSVEKEVRIKNGKPVSTGGMA